MSRLRRIVGSTALTLGIVGILTPLHYQQQETRTHSYEDIDTSDSIYGNPLFDGPLYFDKYSLPDDLFDPFPGYIPKSREAKPDPKNIA